MENQQPIYYRQPETHSRSIRNMCIALAVFVVTVVAIGTTVIVYARELATMLPFSAEKQFVKPYETILGKWFSDHNGDDDVRIYLQELANSLASNMELPDGAEIHVHYINSDTENAFATLGGHIFVFRGLIESVDSENALAMIIAHEIAHIGNRDPLVALGRGYAIQMMYFFITGDHSSGEALASLGGEVSLLHFSREQERQADTEALHAINAHYGHVQGYDKFFRAMQSKIEKHNNDNSEPNKIDKFANEWFASHPDLANRIDSLTGLATDSGYQLTGKLKIIPVEINNESEQNPYEDMLTN